MTIFSEKEITRLKEAASLLLEAEKTLPVLKTLAWDRSHADSFFASGETIPPTPTYSKIDTQVCDEQVSAARALIDGSSPVHNWLTRFADVTERTAEMLGAVGTADFYRHSKELYGSPSTPIADGKRTALDLALHLDEILSEFDGAAVQLDPSEKLTADDLKVALEQELPKYFGEHVPDVEVTDKVSAKAAAGSDYIKLRSDAMFSDLDVGQLLQHEALIHIATGFNGRAQPHFPILGESHAGNARTQEGLAVFSEFISGHLDPNRLKRLADRAIAIDMSAQGADFIELYRFFKEKDAHHNPIEAFESARRVVRGGLVNGGGPFTKDSVYLSGLVDVHHYLRTAIRAGDTKLIRLLFVGKVDLKDLEAMELLLSQNLITMPQLMPPWATDLRYTLSYLAYSTFLNGINAEKIAPQHKAWLSQ